MLLKPNNNLKQLFINLMKKNNRKIVAFILSIAFMGYGLFGFNLLNTRTVFAYSGFKLQDTQIQNQDTGYNQNSVDCTQENTASCSTCVTHNNCHFDYLIVPQTKVGIFCNQKSLVPRNDKNFNNLNHLPESPPS